MNLKKAYRGMLFSFKETTCLADFFSSVSNLEPLYHFEEDGLLIVQEGKIVASGPYNKLKNLIIDSSLMDYRNKLILPGFIDTHLHAAQRLGLANSEHLLEWLHQNIYAAESSHNHPDKARSDLNFFVERLLKNGTTTALCYAPLFYKAADIFFEILDKQDLRFIAGNVLMDQNSPNTLCLKAEDNYDNAKKLIGKWHHHKRLSYCITPRFAITSSHALLELCGTLKKEHPDCYIQTHLNENENEIAEVKRIFKDSKDYLDVYDQFGLVTAQSIFAHCIHNTKRELELLREKNSIISWCPLSNNLLGSGLFSFRETLSFTDKIALGSDWSAGSSISMFAVMREAYKVNMLNNAKLPNLVYWYLATLGAAKSLGLEDKISSLNAGKEADFIVVDAKRTPYTQHYYQQSNNVHEILSLLMLLGDERNIEAVYSHGKPVF